MGKRILSYTDLDSQPSIRTFLVAGKCSNVYVNTWHNSSRNFRTDLHIYLERELESKKWRKLKSYLTRQFQSLSIVFVSTKLASCDMVPASSAGPRCVMGRSHTIRRGPAESCKKMAPASRQQVSLYIILNINRL